MFSLFGWAVLATSLFATIACKIKRIAFTGIRFIVQAVRNFEIAGS
jgi:hypothetical protein